MKITIAIRQLRMLAFGFALFLSLLAPLSTTLWRIHNLDGSADPVLDSILSFQRQRQPSSGMSFSVSQSVPRFSMNNQMTNDQPQWLSPSQQQPSRGYEDPMLSFINNNWTSAEALNLPLPVQVMEQYRKWHGVESLRRSPHNRTFVLGFYTCPCA